MIQLVNQINGLENEKQQYMLFKSQIEPLISGIAKTIESFDPIVLKLGELYKVNDMSADSDSVLAQKNMMSVDYEYLQNHMLPFVNKKIDDISSSIVKTQNELAAARRAEAERQAAAARRAEAERQAEAARQAEIASQSKQSGAVNEQYYIN